MLACFFQIYVGGSGTWSIFFFLLALHIMQKKHRVMQQSHTRLKRIPSQHPATSSVCLRWLEQHHDRHLQQHHYQPCQILESPTIHHPSSSINKNGGSWRYYKTFKAYELMVQTQWKTTLVNIIYLPHQAHHDHPKQSFTSMNSKLSPPTTINMSPSNT